MRRWLGRLAACVLAAVPAAGCHHTAGVCDCDHSCHTSCCYGLGAYHGAMAPYHRHGHHAGSNGHHDAVPPPAPVHHPAAPEGAPPITATPMGKVID